MSDGNGDTGSGQAPAGEGQKPPIEYPAVYPFKVMGRAEQDFPAYVRTLFARLMGAEIAPEAITEQPSSKGTYVSVTVTVVLTSEVQRQFIYGELKGEPRIVYCL